LKIIKEHLPNDFIFIGEGANTMDIARTVIGHDEPRHKLDAGTFGTMGISMPFTIAAKAVFPEKPVVAIVGDSAFGFSAMEIETATRYNLPFVVIILNNNGIYSGIEELPKGIKNGEIPVTALNPTSQYEKMAEAFGGDGYHATNPEQLSKALKSAFGKPERLSIIHVRISTSGARKA